MLRYLNQCPATGTSACGPGAQCPKITVVLSIANVQSTRNDGNCN